jgi:class 3 adenylate cyclase
MGPRSKMAPTESAEDLTAGTVTVLFTDAAGSTELRGLLGDEAADEILRAQDELVRRQIAVHHGREVKGTGDGVMAAFGSARRAVVCAADIQRSLQERNREQHDAHVGVRVGLNSGEVNQRGGDLFGAAVNAAARVAAKAKGGEILVSAVVKQLAGRVPEISFVDRGRFRLKGFDERWQLFEVIWNSEEEPSSNATSERTAASEYLAVELPQGVRMVKLERGRVTIGRGTENVLALSNDRKVSTHHALLDDFGAGWSIEDLGSRNGTYVNGLRLLGKKGLRPGDEIRVGDTVIRYESSRVRTSDASATLVDEAHSSSTEKA